MFYFKHNNNKCGFCVTFVSVASECMWFNCCSEISVVSIRGVSDFNSSVDCT